VPKLKGLEKLVKASSFVYNQGLYAIISKVSKDEFSKDSLEKNLADSDWIKEKVVIHEEVIEEVMKTRCVIPFKFATVFNSEDNLKKMLTEYGDKFRAKLNYLKDKEERSVKVYCDIGQLKQCLIKRKEEPLQVLDNEIESSSPGKAFFLKKRREELIKTIINKKLNEYSEDIFSKMKKESVEASINNLLSKEITARIDDMILNAAFLVERNRVSEFTNKVYILKERYEEEGISFNYSGPWPSYNFC
jgi:hypothetical protein